MAIAAIHIGRSQPLIDAVGFDKVMSLLEDKDAGVVGATMIAVLQRPVKDEELLDSDEFQKVIARIVELGMNETCMPIFDYHVFWSGLSWPSDSMDSRSSLPKAIIKAMTPDMLSQLVESGRVSNDEFRRMSISIDMRDGKYDRLFKLEDEISLTHRVNRALDLFDKMAVTPSSYYRNEARRALKKIKHLSNYCPSNRMILTKDELSMLAKIMAKGEPLHLALIESIVKHDADRDDTNMYDDFDDNDALSLGMAQTLLD